MASIVHITNKQTGITYVYRSESYWDKEKKAPRNRRTLIGKIDPETGKVVETRKRTRKQTPELAESIAPEYWKSVISDLQKHMLMINDQISKMRSTQRDLYAQLQSVASQMDKIINTEASRFK